MAFDPNEYLGATQTPSDQITEQTKNSETAFNPNQYISGTDSSAPQPASTDIEPTGAVPAYVSPASGPLITAQEIQAAKNVAAPITEAAKSAGKMYASGLPGAARAAVDLVSTKTLGLPLFGTFSAISSMKDRAQALQDAYNEASKFASQTSPQVDPQTGKNVQWRGIDAYREMGKAGGPEVAAKLKDAYYNNGGAAGVKRFIESAEGQALAEANPAFRTAAAKYVGEVPGALTQAGRVVAPVARTALRAAGPAALAYDIYENAPQIAAAGQQLNTGQAQDRIKQAQMAALNAPTPAPLTPQEAANLLASGDQRTINMYGGAQKLAQTARNIAAQPEQTSWIDNALNIFQRYRPAIGR